jgi:hypothetical protein
MQLTNAVRKTASLAAITAVAGSAALAGTASAATIDKPVVLGPAQAIPVDFPGYREPANRRIERNHRIVAVHAEVARGERAQTIVTVPKGFGIVTLGFAEGSEIGAQLTNPKGTYVGRRSVRLTLEANRSEVAAGGQTGEGTVYVLARRA